MEEKPIYTITTRHLYYVLRDDFKDVLKWDADKKEKLTKYISDNLWIDWRGPMEDLVKKYIISTE